MEPQKAHHTPYSDWRNAYTRLWFDLDLIAIEEKRIPASVKIETPIRKREVMIDERHTRWEGSFATFKTAGS